MGTEMGMGIGIIGGIGTGMGLDGNKDRDEGNAVNDDDHDINVDIDNSDNAFDEPVEQRRLVEKRRRYPLTTPGGYAPTHLRQQFCQIDYHDTHHRRATSAIISPRPDDENPSPPRRLVSLLTRILTFGRTSSRSSRLRQPETKWWRWEIRATYQRPFSVGRDGTVTPTPSGAHVELSIWTRAGMPLAHAVVWGIPWRRGRMTDVPDVFGAYDGCAGHPVGALGRWGNMLERWAFFADRARGDWTARASVVHDDREWLEKVAPEELVSLVAANS